MQPGAEGWERLRTHFCFLPLQVSHFDELSGAAGYLNLLEPEDEPSKSPVCLARMTSDGHLDIAARSCSELAVRLLGELDLDQAIHIRNVHQERLRRLHDCVAQAGLVTAVASSNRQIQNCWSSTANAVAALAAYGIVTKVISDALLDRSGDGNPEHEAGPHETAGESTNDPEIFDANLSSSALVKGVNELIRELTTVDGDASGSLSKATRHAAVEGFCQRHAGHGPKAWEAPGYEDPGYVWKLVSPRETQSLVRRRSIPAFDDAPIPATWRRELDYWIRHLDTQTTILRWAFLTAELSLLCALAAHWLSDGVIKQASDLLFCSRQEIGDSPPSRGVIARRRDVYQSLIREAGRPELANAPEARMDARIPADTPPLDSLTLFTPATGRPKPALTVRAFRGKSVSCAEHRSGPAWPLDELQFRLPKEPGSVVIARHLSPDLTPALLGAAAVVVEEGGLLQHAAIVAREIGIPCIVGCYGLVGRVAPGVTVAVDGRDGRVTVSGAEGTE